MVRFGESLKDSCREGWEDAYLDYERLKDILDKMGAECSRLRLSETPSASFDNNDDTAGDNNGSYHSRHNKYTKLSNEFTYKLSKEIERVTLFSLSKIGDVANAVGALRFALRRNDVALDKSLNCASSSSEQLTSMVGSFNEKHDEDGDGFNFDEFGERASLLPASTERTYCDLKSSIRGSSRRSSVVSGALFQKEKLVSLVGHQINTEEIKEKDIHAAYSELGVELLHLLKFNCLNAVGIRKIVKKRDKFHHQYTEVIRKQEDSDVDFERTSVNAIFLPDEVSNRLNSARNDRLHQLTDNSSFVALYDSILEALVDCEAKVLQSWTTVLPFSSEPIIFSKDAAIKFLQDSQEIENGLSLLRFECTVSSIHALIEFASDIHKPFQVWLSRKALIDTGKDHGDIGDSDRALQLLLLFEPDFILEMTESELYEWYRRATTAKSSGRRHNRDSTFIDYAVGEDINDWGGVNTASLIINLMSTLLYTVNYYIIAPTANHYASLLGTSGAFGASLIGMSSFSAIFAALVYSVWYMKSSFRSGLIFSAACPLLGNLMYSLAISYDSMKIALIGRFLCGFGSAEVINRQLISACVSYQRMTKASALFVSISAIGMSIGPLIAGVLDMTGGRDVDIDIRLPLPGIKHSGLVLDHCTNPGWLMALLWLVQLLALVFFFVEPERINCSKEADVSESLWSGLYLLPRKIYELFQVICKQEAFLVTLYLFAFIELSGEVLISSCSMIVHRYFDWYGSRAGFIIAALGALVLPAHFIVEHASRRFSEREILKASLVFVFFSSIFICNLEGILLDVAAAILNAKDTEKDKDLKKMEKAVNHALTKHGEFPYDWGAGVFVYLSSLSAIFLGTIVMEGVNTSLMSKSVPKELTGFVNMGLLATLVGTVGRVVGDSLITVTTFIGKAPLHDFVSVTFLPLLPLIAVGYWWMMRCYQELLI